MRRDRLLLSIQFSSMVCSATNKERERRQNEKRNEQSPHQRAIELNRIESMPFCSVCNAFALAVGTLRIVLVHTHCSICKKKQTTM